MLQSSFFSLNISFLFLLGSPSGHAMGSSCVWYVMVTAALSYTVRWKDKSAVTLHRWVSFHYSNSYRYVFIYMLCFQLTYFDQIFIVCFVQFVKNPKPFIMIYFSWRKRILRGFIHLYRLVFINLRPLHTVSLNQLLLKVVSCLQCWKFEFY